MLHELGNRILRLLFRLLVNWEFQGLENVPREGPLIVVGNHVCFLDPLIMGACMGRKVILLSKAENFTALVLGSMMRAYECIPVRRGEADRQALRESMKALRKELALGIFPEGTRSATGGLLEGKSGMILLAKWSGAPILPVGFANTDRVLASLKRLRRPTVSVRIGRPLALASGERLDREQMAAATREVMYQIAALLPPQYRGVYSDAPAARMRLLRPVPAG